MKLHFIAIGGSAMHNLALALHEKGYLISGSDDEIFEPSRSRLKKKGLLPEEEGWFPGRITEELDAVILGMHAKKDNPELLRAKELGLRIFSYPEFLYEQSKDKKRIVIAGSHGKTTITAMVMHVLHEGGVDFDFMVGAQLDGFDVMVRISETAKLMVLEGDEYLTSPDDPRPKFHLYRPHVALITGIAWDHINVFPTYQIYVDQFRQFIKLIEPGGLLTYFEGDNDLRSIAGINPGIRTVPYDLPQLVRRGDVTYLLDTGKEYPLQVFGKHNMQNIAGAMKVCSELGISGEAFAKAISTFSGASRRLQLIAASGSSAVFLDFAHAPSKLRATVEAMKEQYPERKLVACMELHTYSSLSKAFLDQYKGGMDMADVALVYFNPHALKIKRLPAITTEMVKQAFGREDLHVYDDSALMLENLYTMDRENTNLLLMSSGNFDGWDIQSIAQQITS